MASFAPDTGQIILQAANAIVAASAQREQLDLEREKLTEQKRINDLEVSSKEAVLKNKEQYLKLQQEQFAFKQQNAALETEQKQADLAKTRAEIAKLNRDATTGRKQISPPQAERLYDAAIQYDIDKGLEEQGLGQFAGIGAAQLRAMLSSARNDLAQAQAAPAALLPENDNRRAAYVSSVESAQKNVDALMRAQQVISQFSTQEPSANAKNFVIASRGISSFDYDWITDNEQEASRAAFEIWPQIPENRISWAQQTADAEISDGIAPQQSLGFRRLYDFVNRGARNPSGLIEPARFNRVVDYLEANGASEQLLNAITEQLTNNARQ